MSFIFCISRGASAPLPLPNIVGRSRNFGKLSYLVPYICDLNFIKIGYIWNFKGVLPPPHLYSFLRGAFRDSWPLPLFFLENFTQECAFVDSLKLSLYRYLNFQRGLPPPFPLLNIVRRSWNFGNLSYLVSYTYGSNSIKIGKIWNFKGGFCPL